MSNQPLFDANRLLADSSLSDEFVALQGFINASVAMVGKADTQTIGMVLSNCVLAREVLLKRMEPPRSLWERILR